MEATILNDNGILLDSFCFTAAPLLSNIRPIPEQSGALFALYASIVQLFMPGSYRLRTDFKLDKGPAYLREFTLYNESRAKYGERLTDESRETLQIFKVLVMQIDRSSGGIRLICKYGALNAFPI